MLKSASITTPLKIPQGEDKIKICKWHNKMLTILLRLLWSLSRQQKQKQNDKQVKNQSINKAFKDNKILREIKYSKYIFSIIENKVIEHRKLAIHWHTFVDVLIV